MRPSNYTEKRRFKRLELSLPMKLKRILNSGKEEIIDTFTDNVSYNGAYVTDVTPKGIKPEDNLHISLSIPRDSTRDFPFSRLIGKARVVRVEENGVALEFNERINRLLVAS